VKVITVGHKLKSSIRKLNPGSDGKDKFDVYQDAFINESTRCVIIFMEHKDLQDVFAKIKSKVGVTIGS